MLIRWAKRLFALLAVVAVTFLTVRAWDTQRGPPLHIWHTYVPHELSAKEIDAADWTQYSESEARIFEALRREVSQELDPEDRDPVNRSSPAVRCIPRILSRTGTGPMCSSLAELPPARWCSCMA